jgi:uncharacterized protein (TIGR02679 family)
VRPDLERLARLLGGPERADLRARLRRHYERGRETDAITFTRLSPAERQSLEGLLGRPPRAAGSMRVDLQELDALLMRAGLAPSLRVALEVLDGPIEDRAGLRAARSAGWQAVCASVREPRLAALLAGIPGRALLKRLSRSNPTAGQQWLDLSQLVLERLPVSGIPRSQLAAELLHDAHGLDDGRPVAGLVLAALGRMENEERPREVWARVGVLVNELAAPVLTLNLPADPETPAGQLTAAARGPGEPLHLSLRALLRAPAQWAVAGRAVFVCENPAVVVVAADRLGLRCAPMVCTDGMPAAAQRSLLRQLRDAGARLFYHGDFDWPGIHIGNYVMRNFGACPWRFSADDYNPRIGRRLSGKPVTACWDARLAPKMVELDYALEEESVVDGLIAELESGSI